MMLIIRFTAPKTEKERMFCLKIPVEYDLKTPGIASVTLDNKEYQIEVYY